MSSIAPVRSLEEVSSALWKERQLLDLLRFKLEEEQLLLSAGGARWLPTARREIDLVLDRLRTAELLRAVRVDDVAARVGLGPGPTLERLAGVTPEPWAGILERHRKALLESTTELGRLARANRELLDDEPELLGSGTMVQPSLADFLR